MLMEMSSLAFSRSAVAAFRFSLARAYWLGVGGGGLQVQLGQGILVGQLEAGEERDAGGELHVGAVAGRVDIDGGVVAGRLVGHGGLRTSPVPALVGSSVQVGQAGPLGGVHFDGALLGHVGGLADVDVVFDGVRWRVRCIGATTTSPVPGDLRRGRPVRLWRIVCSYLYE